MSSRTFIAEAGNVGLSYPEFLPVSKHQISVILGAMDVETVAIPASTKFVVFSADDKFYASYGSNYPVIPGVSSGQTNTNTEPSPAQRYVGGYSKLRLTAKQQTEIHVSFYS